MIVAVIDARFDASDLHITQGASLDVTTRADSAAVYGAFSITPSIDACGSLSSLPVRLPVNLLNGRTPMVKVGAWDGQRLTACAPEMIQSAECALWLIRPGYGVMVMSISPISGSIVRYAVNAGNRARAAAVIASGVRVTATSGAFLLSWDDQHNSCNVTPLKTHGVRSTKQRKQ